MLGGINDFPENRIVQDFGSARADFTNCTMWSLLGSSRFTYILKLLTRTAFVPALDVVTVAILLPFNLSTKSSLPIEVR